MLPIELEARFPDEDVRLERHWDQAIFQTNEKAPSRPLLERVRGHFEPRYLIGLGSGNLWSHLSAFPNSEPMGVISVDASELVVSGLRILREFLRKYPTREEFLESVWDFLAPPYSSLITLRAYFRSFVCWKGTYPYRSRLYKEQDGYNPLYEPKEATWFSDELINSDTPDIYGLILQNYKSFRRLAIEGRIGVIRRDIRDEKFLKQMPNLDQYGSRNHLVYLSNAFDPQYGGCLDEFDRKTIQPTNGSLVYSVVGANKSEPVMYTEDGTGALVPF